MPAMEHICFAYVLIAIPLSLFLSIAATSQSLDFSLYEIFWKSGTFLPLGCSCCFFCCWMKNNKWQTNRTLHCHQTKKERQQAEIKTTVHSFHLYIVSGRFIWNFMTRNIMENGNIYKMRVFQGKNNTAFTQHTKCVCVCCSKDIFRLCLSFRIFSSLALVFAHSLSCSLFSFSVNSLCIAKLWRTWANASSSSSKSHIINNNINRLWMRKLNLFCTLCYFVLWCCKI